MLAHVGASARSVLNEGALLQAAFDEPARRFDKNQKQNRFQVVAIKSGDAKYERGIIERGIELLCQCESQADRAGHHRRLEGD